MNKSNFDILYVHEFIALSNEIHFQITYQFIYFNNQNMSFSAQFLQQLQQKKKQLNQKWKQTEIDIEQIQHRIQIPYVKLQKQRVKISENQFIYLINAAKNKFLKQSSLLKIQGPIYVATGTYGSYRELSLVFQKCGNPKFVNYLFLGDYTGKYKKGIQCLVALLIYKLKSPFNFFLLRGCFQSISIAKNYCLYEQIKDYFGSTKVWVQLCELFCYLPFCATINDKIFCVHGGINPYIFSLQQIHKIKRPFDTPSKDLPHDLIFSYPSYEAKDEMYSTKNKKYCQIQASNFLKRTNMQLICRGHAVVQNGFEYIFNNLVVNVCSISNFSNLYRNSSAVMMVDDKFNIIFKQINNQISPKTQQNQQGLTFQEIVLKRQQTKRRLQQIQRKQNQKLKDLEQKMQKEKIQNIGQEEKRKEKEQRKKLKRLKRQMLEQMCQKQLELKKLQEAGPGK